ncbi:MAG: methylmalonyl-CoA epimerase [Sphingobacteriales bacterium]|nr:MAG: methylmalonyl-CoA epimerase [Sphingobacteriales bacterium]
MTKIEHLGIAVEDLNAAIPVWEALLNTPCYKTEEVTREGVLTAFFRMGESKIELLEGTRPESAIKKFIDKKGPGVHHVAFAVDDIQAEANRLQTAGFEVIGDGIPKPGADNKLVLFLHPKAVGGILVELCQEREAR